MYYRTLVGKTAFLSESTPWNPNSSLKADTVPSLMRQNLKIQNVSIIAQADATSDGTDFCELIERQTHRERGT